MGVPKFFRYISERYPCLSEFVKEYQIPMFDNLYLDMNGIIHMCSHPDDNNPHFRITEEKIFSDIFHYIEFLFRMIKPQKVFFMAVDGVAPRAKMNQQRGRRFRTAKDAEKLETEAKRKGEMLPEQERFDSNCITPGTEFMARLHEQLKYFIVSKISSDKMWKKCKIILSGHETPGEGEHKIMDYIRYIRSQQGYDPNTRHCLYGLDADLIMLGLCTHEPHFSLLREEVKFGKKAKRTNIPEEIRFYLLHLSLMREYLELEFGSLKESLRSLNKFEFDIEKIIDDWILMGFLVGNDFIPNLPNLHIANGALPILYKAYIEVLPTLDGYINEQGTLNLERFETFMKKLSDIDIKNFEENHFDMKYFEEKTGRKQTFHTPVQCKSLLSDPADNEERVETVRDPALAALLKSGDEFDTCSEDESDESSSNEDEDFKNFKNEYYMNKLEYQKVTPKVMREQAEGYVRAIQWNLNYYYNGVCSWSWFYPHHYAPYISDIKGFANLKFDFELGKPFKPYEQLLAVLPTKSKNLLPKCYHHLMTDESSQIKSYYPTDFQTDLNGKRQEWEAVVLVPFIDEKVLLDAMESCNELLTAEEKQRNTHGPMLIYEYTDEDLGIYKAPDYFPSVKCQTRCITVNIEDIRVPKDKLIKGIYPGAYFDVFYPGFPTMKHLKYEAQLIKAKVKVFEMPSRNENMILKLLSDIEYFNDSVPLDLLGNVVWVGWPHLVEAKVVALSTKKTKYVLLENRTPNYKEEETKLFDSELEGITKYYRERLGIDFGNTKILVHVQTMIGRKYIFASSTRITLDKQFSSFVSNYPLQSIVRDIKVYDECHTTYADVTEVFPKGSICFSLTQPHYGSQGTIIDNKDCLKNNNLKVLLTITEEPDLSTALKAYVQSRNSYQNLGNSASQLSISNYVFSRITGSLYVSTKNSEKPINIGLDLKFNKRNEEIPGYTKKIDNNWAYSSKAVDIVRDYLNKYPEVFDCLTNDSNNKEHDMTTDDIVGGEEKIKEIQAWLKSLPSYSTERRVCGSEVLDSEVVSEIEKAVDSIKESSKTITMQIKPHLLFKPELHSGNLAPDPSATTKVFDRIVNVREGFTVPFGFKGTVIGIYKSSSTLKNEDELYDIVFDKKFTGGMSLNCSEHRGYRLAKTSFLNLSFGKRQMEQKTGVPGALRALAKEQRISRNNSNEICVNPASSINIRPQQISAFASFNKLHSNLVPAAASNRCNFYPQYSRSYIQTETFPEPLKVSSCVVDSSQVRIPKTNQETSVNQKSTLVDSHRRSYMKGSQKSVAIVQKPVNTKQRTEVNTDFLKRILNIDNISNRRSRTSASQQHNSTSDGNVKPQHNEMLSSSSSSNKRIQGSNSSSATTRLLSYYQRNMLGCPRYTYFEDDNGLLAEVVLPNGETICGKVARTREEASENVAKDALNLLSEHNSKPTKESFPFHFPTPPTKWVERQQQNKTTHTFVNKSHQTKQHNKISVNSMDYKKESETDSNRDRISMQQNCPINNTNFSAASFVPLQALKKRQTQSNKNLGDNTNKSMNEGSQKTKQENTEKPKNASQGNNTDKVQGVNTKDKSLKSGRSRRTRIAANFNK